MRCYTAFAITALMFAVSCSLSETADPFAQTEIGKRRVQLYQSRTLADAVLHPERDTSFEALLGDAAFEITRGMDADRAVETFVADGAACDGSTCVWKYTVREAMFPCGLPPLSLVSMCLRPPGPRRTFEASYEVILLGQRIQDRADVSSRALSHTVTTTE